MGEVKKLHNCVIIDANFASELWATLLEKQGSLPAEQLATTLSLKMYDQDCGFSDEALNSLEGTQSYQEIIREWASPVLERMEEIDKAKK